MSDNLASTGLFVNTPQNAYEVMVDRAGRFIAVVNGREITSSSFDGLRVAVIAAVREKAVRVEIPFSMLSERRFGVSLIVDGVCIGKHAGTGNLLLKINGGRTEQSRWRSEYFRKMSDAEKKKFAALSEALDKASKAFDAFKDSLRLDLSEEVRKLIDAAKKDAEAAEKGKKP